MATVVLQLGHCHRRRGATGTTGEQELVIRVGRQAAADLAAAGHRAVLALADDPVPSGDVFVALHADGSTNRSARGCSFGYETGVSTSARSRAFGTAWQVHHVRQGYPGTTRAANYTAGLEGYYALDDARRAGHDRVIIVELGFLTNQDDRDWLTSAEGVRASARALTAAVVGVHGGQLPAQTKTRSWMDMATEAEVRSAVRGAVREEVTRVVTEVLSELRKELAKPQLTTLRDADRPGQGMVLPDGRIAPVQTGDQLVALREAGWRIIEGRVPLGSPLGRRVVEPELPVTLIQAQGQPRVQALHWSAEQGPRRHHVSGAVRDALMRAGVPLLTVATSDPRTTQGTEGAAWSTVDQADVAAVLASLVADAASAGAGR